ncbi:MAG TPA: MFS transporter [Actinophytocola sp.]|uniref:MFS transporter n=1 Tax=Actinophytocola sp. TaxID=1872138 RepID=UPI002DBCD8CE|nr:MFS transporter [Actinophytocola sp.]HEU5474061.1 MFS transporter [Actinophytocola sp.]
MTGPDPLRRYLLLLALRWFPVGLAIPVLVLLGLSRGLTLAEVGLAVSMQGFVVLALELPTGGLADSWGRRPVLLLAAAIATLALLLLATADSFAEFAVVYLLQGVYRALDSGPLQAWYVDAALAADPNARLEKGLSAGGTVLGVAIGLAALASGAVIAWVEIPGIPTLTLPIWLGLAVQLANLVAILVLVREPARAHGRAFLPSLRGVPAVITESCRLVRRSRILLALLAVELCWGFSMVTFEMLMPVKLAEEVGGTQTAAALTGPAGAAAWFGSAAGAALAPLLSARIGVAPTAAILRVAHGLTVAAMGLLAGPAGVLAGYLACYVVHGASNPVHETLLHREISGSHRSTVLSMNSMISQAAGAVGLITLTALATATSVTTAITTGAIVLALAAPLYLPAARSRQLAQR